MDFYENLNMRYSGLTKQGKKIADFIFTFGESCATMTAQELGERSETSASAIIRFCKQLGYDSLEVMKIDIAKAYTEPILTEPIDTIISEEDDVVEMTKKTIKIIESSFHNTISGVDYRELEKAIELIKKADCVHIYGIGSSSAIALDLLYKLVRINKPSYYHMDGHMNLQFSPLISPKDVVIAFSYSGETKEVFFSAMNAKKNGAKVISVTKNAKTTLGLYSNIILPVSDDEKRVRVGAISSTFSMMLISHLLYLGIIKDNLSDIEPYLIKTAKAVEQLRK